jgi:beta-lactam-binding protein with PASTA domain
MGRGEPKGSNEMSIKDAARVLAGPRQSARAAMGALGALIALCTFCGTAGAQISYIVDAENTAFFLQTAAGSGINMQSELYIYPENYISPASTGVSSESFSGEISVSSPAYSGVCSNFTIIAALGASNAVFECYVGPTYFLVTGTVNPPVGPYTTTNTTFANITLNNLYATLSTAAYTAQNFVKVPSVASLSQAAAETQLESTPLSIGTVSTQTSATVAAGDVISTSPASTASVPAYWPVNLLVSSGPPAVTVPNVSNVGLSQSAAIQQLTSLGLTVNTVTLSTSTAALSGIVIGQSPAASTQVAAGAAIALTVGAGPATTPQNIVYTGGGSQYEFSYFTYNLYSIDGLPFSATISSSFATGLDANGNSVTLTLNYVPEGLGTIACATGSECLEPFSQGSGQLSVQTCVVGAAACSTTQGTLGATSDGIYAGTSLAALAAGSVSQATIQLGYHQTQSYNGATGITTLTPDAPQIYVILRGIASASGPGLQVPIAVPICYGAKNYGSCGPEGGPNDLTVGPYFNTFNLDWTATLSATPFGVSSSSVTVPKVVGLSQTAAGSALSAAGLMTGTITRQASTTVAAGDVVSQSPSAGSSVTSGAAVNLVISSGPPSVDVPSVVGLTQAAAGTALTGAGLVAGTITQQASDTVTAGDVISQSPVAGTPVADGSSVNLVVSSGAASVVIVPGGAPQVAASATTYTVTLLIENTGNVTVNTLHELSATLGGTAATSVSPSSLGGLAPGTSGSLVLVFPASAGSGRAVLDVGGSYSADALTGDWSIAARVTLPAAP